MNKQHFIDMGLTEEQTQKVTEWIDKNLIEKSNENITNLEKQIEALQEQLKTQKKTHDTELTQLKLDNAIEMALNGAGAKNAKAVRSLFDMEKLKFSENGKVESLQEQIETIKQSDPYLFHEKQQTFKGFQPGVSADLKPNVDTSKMTYSELTAFMAANPNIKID